MKSNLSLIPRVLTKGLAKKGGRGAGLRADEFSSDVLFSGTFDVEVLLDRQRLGSEKSVSVGSS